MIRKIGIALLLVIVAAGVYVYVVAGRAPMDFAGGKSVALDKYSAANPTGVPAELAQTDLVKRGEYLARAADCAACHTARGGQAFTGGLPFKFSFGTLYSPNITPDPATGIGAWTDAQFLQAVHKGIGRDGERLYPAFPYTSYALLTDADVLAIKAYLFSLAPVSAPRLANSLKFPFNQRWLMAGWSAIYRPGERFQPIEERSAEWNRGAYLVEGLAHCGDCHTPRSLLMGQNQRKKFAGNVVTGWHAYNITADADSGIGAWSEADLASYLSTGHAAGRGTASGPMSEAVELSLRHLAPSDIQAIVAYVRSVPAISDSDSPPKRVEPAPASFSAGVAAATDSRGKLVFAGACAGCHGWTGESPVLSQASLLGTRGVNDPAGTNVVQIMLSGEAHGGAPGSARMPSFGHAYSDAEIAATANYVIARFGGHEAKISAEKVADLRSQSD
jgi:mono/diheme cytochrome c family protein